MPQAAAGAVFSGLFLAGASAAVAGAIAIATYVIVTVAVTTGLSKLSQALAGKPKGPNAGANSRDVSVRGSVEPRQMIYGEVETGGYVAFIGTSGTGNRFLWFVIVAAGHECEDILSCRLDSRVVPDGDIAGDGEVSTAAFVNDGTPRLWIYRELGEAGSTANSALNSAFAEWTSDHRGFGICRVVYKLDRDDVVWPSGPPANFFQLVRGARLYDPRKDTTNGGSGSHRVNNPSTWEWSQNAVLAVRDYVSGGTIVYDSNPPDKRLRAGELDSRINDAFTIASANLCDEEVDIPGAITQPRYTCNVQLSCGDIHRENLDVLLSACVGHISYVEGKCRIIAGAYDTPVISLDEDDVLGAVDVLTHPQGEELYNLVTGTFYDDQRNWVQSSFPPVGNATYEADDGGQYPRAIELHATRSSYRAQRIAFLHLLQSRNKISVRFSALSPKAMDIAEWDTFYVTIGEFSWAAKVFRCIEWEFLPSGLIAITAREESALSYIDPDPGDYAGPLTSSTPSFDIESPARPDNLRTVGQDNGVLAIWAPSTTPGVMYVVEESTASNMSSPVIVYTGPDAQALIEKSDTGTYYYRVRARHSGLYSAYEPKANGVSGAATSVTSGFRATATPGSVFRTTTLASSSTPSTTASPINGVAPFTYSWARISGDSSMTIGSASSASTSFARSGMALETDYSAIFRCTITDNTAATATVDVTATISRTNNN